jgi:hypothetical protein
MACLPREEKCTPAAEKKLFHLPRKNKCTLATQNKTLPAAAPVQVRTVARLAACCSKKKMICLPRKENDLPTAEKKPF